LTWARAGEAVSAARKRRGAGEGEAASSRRNKGCGAEDRIVCGQWIGLFAFEDERCAIVASVGTGDRIVGGGEIIAFEQEMDGGQAGALRHQPVALNPRRRQREQHIAVKPILLALVECLALRQRCARAAALDEAAIGFDQGARRFGLAGQPASRSGADERLDSRIDFEVQGLAAGPDLRAAGPAQRPHPRKPKGAAE
jgi:hypothetical protein